MNHEIKHLSNGDFKVEKSVSPVIQKDHFEVGESDMGYCIPLFNSKGEFRFHLEVSKRVHDLFFGLAEIEVKDPEILIHKGNVSPSDVPEGKYKINNA